MSSKCNDALNVCVVTSPLIWHLVALQNSQRVYGKILKDVKHTQYILEWNLSLKDKNLLTVNDSVVSSFMVFVRRKKTVDFEVLFPPEGSKH